MNSTMNINANINAGFAPFTNDSPTKRAEDSIY